MNDRDKRIAELDVALNTHFDRANHALKENATLKAQLAEARELLDHWRDIAECLPARGVGINPELQSRINAVYNETPKKGGEG